MSALGLGLPRVLVTVVVVLASGCFGQAVPDPVRYDLGVVREATAAPDGSPVLRIGNVRVPSRYDDAAFVYLDEGGVWKRDFYSRFSGPPGTVIREAFTDWLASAGLFAAVLDGPSFIESDLRLQARVRDLYVDRRHPEAPEAVFAIEVEVAQSAAGGGALIFYERFDRRARLAHSGGDAVRDAWAELIEGVLRDVEAGLRGSLR